MKEKNKEVLFTKEQLLGAACFFDRKDAVGAVVKDGEAVTMAEAKKRLDGFMKGRVK